MTLYYHTQHTCELPATGSVLMYASIIDGVASTYFPPSSTCIILHVLCTCVQADHFTPLEVAALKGHTKTVERLLEGGANINKVMNKHTVGATFCHLVLTTYSLLS